MRRHVEARSSSQGAASAMGRVLLWRKDPGAVAPGPIADRIELVEPGEDRSCVGA